MPPDPGAPRAKLGGRHIPPEAVKRGNIYQEPAIFINEWDSSSPITLLSTTTFHLFPELAVHWKMAVWALVVLVVDQAVQHKVQIKVDAHTGTKCTCQ